jgi:uncharacterized protein YbcI
LRLARASGPPRGWPSAVQLTRRTGYPVSVPAFRRGPIIRSEARTELEVLHSEADQADRGALAAAVARSTVQLLNQHTGRGPTKARAYITDELITVVLRDTLNQGERSLAREGKLDVVLGVRKAYQETMGPSLISAIEGHSGRRVIAFLSANHLDPDIAIESFVMGPVLDGHADGALQAAADLRDADGVRA